MSLARAESEVVEQIDRAHRYRLSLTYEQGVEAALRWVLGWTDDEPMEADDA